MANKKINNGEFYPDFKSDEIGYSVRQNSGRLLIMIEIYKKEEKKEILDKMVAIKNKIIEEMLLRTGEDVIVSMVDAREIIEQIGKHTVIGEMGTEGFVEVVDLLTGDFVSVELVSRGK